MAQGRPYQAYQNTQVQTSNQKQLIVMLFDGMSRFTGKAIAAIGEGDIEVAHANLHRTGQILLELLSTLREEKGGEIARNLRQLYVYCYEKTVIANLKKDAEMVREVKAIVDELADGWRHVGRGKAGQGSKEAAPRQIRVTG